MDAGDKVDQILIVRHHMKIGSGTTDLLRLDAKGGEVLVRKCEHRGWRHWFRDVGPAIDDATMTGAKRVVFDFADVPWIGAVYLADLIEWWIRFETDGGRIVFTNLVPRVAETFELTELNRAFVVQDSIPAAVDFLLRHRDQKGN